MFGLSVNRVIDEVRAATRAVSNASVDDRVIQELARVRDKNFLRFEDSKPDVVFVIEDRNFRHITISDYNVHAAYEVGDRVLLSYREETSRYGKIYRFVSASKLGIN
ncbi:hypothetical protein J4216_00460 [Candidatus Woesearchaeota archaeon]|nr:hypothetical protein [Candidatus Woesearchaeota archaeon]